MTRKHFQLLAATVETAREDFSSNAKHACFAATLADTLARTNPRFDRSRFILACMPREWVGTCNENVWMRAAWSV